MDSLYRRRYLVARGRVLETLRRSKMEDRQMSYQSEILDNGGLYFSHLDPRLLAQKHVHSRAITNQ
jgi:hypothetical protein